MSYDSILDKFLDQMDSLAKIANASQERIISDTPDHFFVNNVNFLAKSFLINMCSCLEAFLKEIANAYISDVNERLKKTNIPHNIVVWALKREIKQDEAQYKEFIININQKDIDDNLSGNIHRTIKFFSFLGIDLNKGKKFKLIKGQVQSTVDIRNKIIHYDETSGEITFIDIAQKIRSFKEYATSIRETMP